MILMVWDKSRSVSPGVVLLFGSGLIGTAIFSALLGGSVHASAKRFGWSWPLPTATEIQTVELAALQALAERPDADFSVIWAAGRSGFGSDEKAMADELMALDRVLQVAKLIGNRMVPESRKFIHVSSAGGLFEGQVACGKETVPRPLRSYGHGKLSQEQIIRTDSGLGHRLILRPSSVYGYVPGARRGLVATLIASSIQHSTATIFGSLLTLRDYIYAPDIGRFVAKRLSKPMPSEDAISTETCLLASARPASLFEIIRLVEGGLGRGLAMRIDPRPENARNNTFLPSALPEDFQPTRLQEGVALTISAVTGERFLGALL